MIKKGQLMASSVSCKNFIFEDVVTDSCFCNSDFKESCLENENSTPSIMEKIVNGISFEDLDISSVGEKDDLMVEELGSALSDILHVCDSFQLLCGINSTTNHDETYSPDAMDMTSLGKNILEDFNKQYSAQWTEQVQSPPPMDVTEVLLSTTPHVDSSSKPTTPKLVSAIKGSRAQQEMLPKSKLSVTWSPDVYDPPATSESHTVKSHHHRPKALKKDHREQKHGKGKSYKGSTGDRKYVSRKSTSNMIDPRILRLVALQ